jgi:uncharacterized protein (UPF0276 family)
VSLFVALLKYNIKFFVFDNSESLANIFGRNEGSFGCYIVQQYPCDETGTQDFLERKIAIENVSYYTPVGAQMDEATFISSIIEEADCNLLLDVNNVYVNSFNHKYDPKQFILSLPLQRVSYIHMAGHEKVSPELIIDTHGGPIIDPVYDLFDWTLQHIMPVPVLLERDFNIPSLNELQQEVDQLQKICTKRWENEYVVAS